MNKVEQQFIAENDWPARQRKFRQQRGQTAERSNTATGFGLFVSDCPSDWSVFYSITSLFYKFMLQALARPSD
jgi:hypothetical protein